MRLYGVNRESEFKEYMPQRFMSEHREKTIEAWLEQNPESIIEDGGLLIIGKQVTTNLNTSIDLLGIDREGKLAVVELKRDKTPRDTLAQALEYASFAATLSSDQLEDIYQRYINDENASLIESHKTFFSLDVSEAVSLNKDQRIIIVGSEILPSVRQAASYLRQKGMFVTCLEFSYFKAESGEQLLSMIVVIGHEPVMIGRVSTETLPITNKNKFLKECDEAGKMVFVPLLAMADSEKLPIHWGSRGFSINLDYYGSDIALCFGYPIQSKTNQTPQSLYTGFREIARKVEGAEILIEDFKQKFIKTGKFVPAGKFELKYLIYEKPVTEQVTQIIELILDLSLKVRTLAS